MTKVSDGFIEHGGDESINHTFGDQVFVTNSVRIESEALNKQYEEPY